MEITCEYCSLFVVKTRLTACSEGDTYGYRWRWNLTIGPLTQRPGRPGTWAYQNTDGLGLIEYLQVRVDHVLNI